MMYMMPILGEVNSRHDWLINDPVRSRIFNMNISFTGNPLLDMFEQFIDE
jgi:hypothetical protein